MPPLTRTNFFELRLALLNEEPGCVPPGAALRAICAPHAERLRAPTSTPPAEHRPEVSHMDMAAPELGCDEGLASPAIIRPAA